MTAHPAVVAQPAALMLVAFALLMAPGPAAARGRVRALPAGPQRAAATSAPSRWLPWFAGAATGAAAVLLVGGLAGGLAGAIAGPVVAGGTVLGAHRMLAGHPVTPRPDPLVLAGSWDLLAACLRAGLPLAAAVRAVAGGLPEPAASELHRVAELLALGADSAQAWQSALQDPDTARLARAARRSARTGSALAGAVTQIAEELRAGARDEAETRAQRVGVLVTGPLGLCFLPAFLCLGVVPVVIGLAGQLVTQW